MNKLLPIVLIALILVSAVQAYQLNALKEKLEGGKVSVSPALSGAQAAQSAQGGAVANTGAASGATDINSLPSMVGGC